MRGRIDQNGVAVRLRLGDQAGADGLRGAGPVLDDDGLPDLLRHLIEYHPRQDVGGAARGQRDDHTHDLLARPLLSVPGIGEASEQKGCKPDPDRGPQ